MTYYINVATFKITCSKKNGIDSVKHRLHSGSKVPTLLVIHFSWKFDERNSITIYVFQSLRLQSDLIDDWLTCLYKFILIWFSRN